MYRSFVDPVHELLAGQEDHRGGCTGASLSGRGETEISFVHVHMLLHDQRRLETVHGGLRAGHVSSVRRSLGTEAHHRAAGER